MMEKNTRLHTTMQADEQAQSGTSRNATKIPNVNILIDQQSVGMVLLGRITKSFLS